MKGFFGRKTVGCKGGTDMKHLENGTNRKASKPFGEDVPSLCMEGKLKKTLHAVNLTEQAAIANTCIFVLRQMKSWQVDIHVHAQTSKSRSTQTTLEKIFLLPCMFSVGVEWLHAQCCTKFLK